MRVRLDAVITKAPKRVCGSNSYPVLSITKENGLVLQSNRFKKQIASVDQRKYLVVERGQLVLSIHLDEGVLGIQDVVEEGIVSPAYKIWNVDTGIVRTGYLELLLKAPQSIEFYKSKAQSSVSGRCNINDKELLEMEIEIPSLRVQDKKLRLVEKVKQIIDCLQKEQIALDDLIKARFAEMFGDPKVNDKGFTKAPMGKYMTLLTDFSSNGSYKTLDSGVTMYDKPNYAWMVRTTDLESGDMTSIKYIDEKAYELLSKSKIYGGEIIMNKIGSAGKIYLMPEITMPASLGRNAFMFRYDDRVNVRFLYEQLASKYGQAEIQQYVRGAVTKTITKDDARAVMIIVPDKKLQDEYVEFVKQVDKSKVAVQKALDETKLLYDSLMQEYFG